jgi:tRNA dimethylallyltransferase
MPSADHPLLAKSVAKINSRIPLVVILGPTAVGKTELAIQLAECFKGEIVSADSRLFYLGMDIGTAKPTLQQQVRVPHHLIDVAEPDEIWSLAVFQQEANNAIHQIFARRHLPFLVGGTGQFIRAVIEGWKIPPAKPDPQLREALTHWVGTIGPRQLHAKLALIDPQAAQGIDPTNVRRTIRALEVILSTGKRFSDQRISGHLLYEPLLLGLNLPRTELYQRIDERISRMLEQGFIEEVHQLLDRGFSPDLATMSAIGYGEMVSYLQGKITLDEAIVSMKRRTRIFVRRQANWFKQHDPDIHWFQVSAGTKEEMDALIRNWLNSSNWFNAG